MIERQAFVPWDKGTYATINYHFVHFVVQVVPREKFLYPVSVPLLIALPLLIDMKTSSHALKTSGPVIDY